MGVANCVSAFTKRNRNPKPWKDWQTTRQNIASHRLAGLARTSAAQIIERNKKTVTLFASLFLKDFPPFGSVWLLIWKPQGIVCILANYIAKEWVWNRIVPSDYAQTVFPYLTNQKSRPSDFQALAKMPEQWKKPSTFRNTLRAFLFRRLLVLKMRTVTQISQLATKTVGVTPRFSVEDLELEKIRTPNCQRTSIWRQKTKHKH